MIGSELDLARQNTKLGFEGMEMRKGGGDGCVRLILRNDKMANDYIMIDRQFYVLSEQCRIHHHKTEIVGALRMLASCSGRMDGRADGWRD